MNTKYAAARWHWVPNGRFPIHDGGPLGAFEQRPGALCLALLIVAFVEGSCDVSRDKHLAAGPQLTIDDFKSEVTTPDCPLNEKIWPANATSQDAGTFCQSDGRVNRLGRCPNAFADCSAPDAKSTSEHCDDGTYQYFGRICVSYVDQPSEIDGPFMQVAFDVSQTGGGPPADAFSCIFEYLRSDSDDPLNVKDLGLSQLSFWVRPWQSNTNLEVSITDSASNETAPKATLFAILHNQWPDVRSWTQVKVPLSELATGHDGTTLNLASLTGLGFCVAHNSLSEINSGTAMRGTIDINDISFTR